MAVIRIFSTCGISIHALLAESDGAQSNWQLPQPIFLSTLSLRRATLAMCAVMHAQPYFYPRSPCGERLKRHIAMQIAASISIHALLAESDNRCVTIYMRHRAFLSTLSLRRATLTLIIGFSGRVFLSTLSLRRATCYSFRHSAQGRHFYPRSPCGERLILGNVVAGLRMLFLSTLSLRRAT